jgi:hypothetical protein
LPQLADRGHRRTEPDQEVTWAQQAIDGLLALQYAADAVRLSIRTAPFFDLFAFVRRGDGFTLSLYSEGALIRIVWSKIALV